MRRLVVVTLLAALPGIAAAHGGGLDGNGGHYNRKTGVYHCHREPCFSKQAKPKSRPNRTEQPVEAKDETKREHAGEGSAR